MSASKCLFCDSVVEDNYDSVAKLSNVGIPKITESNIERGDGCWEKTENIQLTQLIHKDCGKMYIRASSIKAGNQCSSASSSTATCSPACKSLRKKLCINLNFEPASASCLCMLVCASC